MKDEKLNAVVARIKIHETHQVWSIFGSCDAKADAVVAQSAFASEKSQNAQDTSGHLWKLRCGKVHAIVV